MSMITAFSGFRTVRFLWDICYICCIELRLCPKEKLKGAWCSEPVESRVPSIGFL